MDRTPLKSGLDETTSSSKTAEFFSDSEHGEASVPQHMASSSSSQTQQSREAGDVNQEEIRPIEESNSSMTSNDSTATVPTSNALEQFVRVESTIPNNNNMSQRDRRPPSQGHDRRIVDSSGHSSVERFRNEPSENSSAVGDIHWVPTNEVEQPLDDDDDHVELTLATATSSGRHDSDETFVVTGEEAGRRKDFLIVPLREIDGEMYPADLVDDGNLREDAYFKQHSLTQRTCTEESLFADEPQTVKVRRGLLRTYSSRHLNGLKTHGRNFRRLMKNDAARWCVSKFPRALAIFIGIILPLWGLNFVSLLFGVWLAATEAPSEIAHNDLELAKEARAQVSAHTATNVTAAAPRICAELYMSKQDLARLDIGSVVMQALDQPTPEPLRHQGDIFEFTESQAASMNWTEWYYYMADCGEAVRSYAQTLSDLSSAAERAAASVDLSFNWIRCHEDVEGKLDAFLSDKLPISDLNLQSQSQTYHASWNLDQERLFDLYFEEFTANNMSEAEAQAQAYNRSIDEATGGDQCTLNGPGAAFFWFTVMTTIGYGNQAPDSTGGRTLLYTMGFVSILAFGSILATAGTISSAVFDDIATRQGLKVLTKPWCACIVWGCFYYGWMALIAWAAQAWKNNRVDGEFSFKDGYWFAYLSTTTVGLGDVYLEPEVIMGTDLLYVPIMMLSGFVFLAAFLQKFRELVMEILKQKRATFIESLLMQMKRDDDEDGGVMTQMAGRMFVAPNHPRELDDDDDNDGAPARHDRL